MTISVIRTYSDEDAVAIEKTAARFCNRHNIANDPDFTSEINVEEHIENLKSTDPEEACRLSRLWQQCYCRTFGLPYDARITAAYGYLGYRVD